MSQKLAELAFSWSEDGDPDLGQVDLMVHSGEFAGHGYSWFPKTKLLANFAVPLRDHPLALDAPPITLEDGIAPGNAIFGITVSPHDRRGNLLVRVDLGSAIQSNPEEELQHSVTVRFLVDHQTLHRFAVKLVRMLEEAGGTVILASQNAA